MDDLQICKRIAEINNDSIMLMKSALGTRYMIMGKGHDGYREYNPLTDDALCFQLMVKYDINLTSMEPTLKDGSDGYEYTCYKQGAYQNVSAILSIDKSPNKAICLAIIEAHKEKQ